MSPSYPFSCKESKLRRMREWWEYKREFSFLLSSRRSAILHSRVVAVPRAHCPIVSCLGVGSEVESIWKDIGGNTCIKTNRTLVQFIAPFVQFVVNWFVAAGRQGAMIAIGKRIITETKKEEGAGAGSLAFQHVCRRPGLSGMPIVIINKGVQGCSSLSQSYHSGW